MWQDTYCDKTQKFQLWQISKTQIVTKLELWQLWFIRNNNFKGSFSKNLLTPWQPVKCSLDWLFLIPLMLVSWNHLYFLMSRTQSWGKRNVMKENEVRIIRINQNILKTKYFFNWSTVANLLSNYNVCDLCPNRQDKIFALSLRPVQSLHSSPGQRPG